MHVQRGTKYLMCGRIKGTNVVMDPVTTQQKVITISRLEGAREGTDTGKPRESCTHGERAIDRETQPLPKPQCGRRGEREVIF